MVWFGWAIPSFNMYSNAYDLSLTYTDEIFTKVFGEPGETRKGSSHGPIFIQKSVLNQCYQDFKKYWARTSSHKFRMATDFQFSFAYNNYLVEKRKHYTPEQIFHLFDEDVNRVLSYQEVVSMLKSIQQTNVKSSWHIESLTAELEKCKQQDESFFDYALRRFRWRINKETFLSCSNIFPILAKLKGELAFKFQVSDSNNLNFRMLTSDIVTMIHLFKDIKRNPKKMICLNNDLKSSKHKVNEIIQGLQLQFYEDLFPTRSRFEIPDQHFKDPLHLKKRFKCSIESHHLSNTIFCLENSGNQFNLTISNKKKDRIKGRNWRT
ncbi:N-acetylglucosamine-1-phosphotransferase subunits alpha/beta [Eurytemora carolleeae]|uniref:N-acetylglucosamine-1-phosphotransferase subunits alpha/beta n=1 Tax=Eurytemora carolleeae TaxID=1294199 RepID=UPI000C759311|nr:N-acetylglucosamine-1-phosphotransferase subunits alpha/beta [Eurytemora carolleeae]|eukprot:XP_023347220.1 N-acetylglucosamine-1-phosphotransferase subunits alpha/beta-like [Eurytemora affinis]